MKTNKARKFWDADAAQFVKRVNEDRAFKRLVANEMMRIDPARVYWPQEVADWLNSDVHKRIEPRYGVGRLLIAACAAVREKENGGQKPKRGARKDRAKKEVAT